MCNEAVQKKPRVLGFVADHCKTQEMCNRAIEKNAWVEDVPDQYKTHEM